MRLNDEGEDMYHPDDKTLKNTIKQQCAEFDERCRTLPEYAVYRDEKWLKKNATYDR